MDGLEKFNLLIFQSKIPSAEVELKISYNFFFASAWKSIPLKMITLKVNVYLFLMVGYKAITWQAEGLSILQ